jgi:hypothetical protein
MGNPMTVVGRHLLKHIVIFAAAAAGSILPLPSAQFIASALAEEVKQQFAGAPGEEIPLRLELPAQLPQDDAGNAGYIRILGLPPSFFLNRGFAAAGAWAVLLSDASGLTVSAPADFVGNLLLTIEMVQDQNTEPQKWQVMLVLAKKGAGASPPQAALASVVPGAPGSPERPAESIGSMKAAAPLKTASRAMMGRAKELLQSNDVAAARLIFKRLAESGLGEAAFNLAQTYDPDFLKTIPTAGLTPDPEMARQWYQRAAYMGYSAAATRLSELGAR